MCQLALALQCRIEDVYKQVMATVCAEDISKQIMLCYPGVVVIHGFISIIYSWPIVCGGAAHVATR